MRAVTPRLLDAAPEDDPEGFDLRVLRRLLGVVVGVETQMQPVVCEARTALGNRFGLTNSTSETGSSDTVAVQGRMLMPDSD